MKKRKEQIPEMTLKIARAILRKPESAYACGRDFLESVKAHGYIECHNKTKEVWAALMDIGTDTEHACACACAQQRIDCAREAIKQWEEIR